MPPSCSSSAVVADTVVGRCHQGKREHQELQEGHPGDTMTLAGTAAAESCIHKYIVAFA